MTTDDISSSPATGNLPLSGITILDLSGYIAGPYGCTLLADQGAEVIKIEPPAGDNLRSYPSTLAAEGRAFVGVNRGKLGLCLDLKQPAGLEVLLRMAESADVLVHNFRPSVPPRLGIDSESLAARNPRLIYCALTGYGDSGPMKDRAGYDQVLQAMTGICTVQGLPGDPEIVYGSVVDYYAASLLAGAVSSALYERERTGRGRYVDISLLRAALAMQSSRLVWADNEGREVGRDMRSGGITGLHPTAGGFLYLSANTPHFWAALCSALGLQSLAEDPRYATVRLRAQNAADIVPQIRQALKAHTAVEWESLLGETVPCAAARSVEDMFEHPQVLAQGMISEFNHPLVGAYRGLSSAHSFTADGAAPAQAAPTFGQHTQELLQRHGYSGDQIRQLRESKAVA